MDSSYLSKENLIYKTLASNDKIYIREQKGLFQRIRRSLNFFLMAIFALVPFIKYNSSQAVYFDLQQQQFHFFALTLFPQDLLIVCFIFVFSAFLLFYITKLFGRVWCGFTCPQTVWMLIFNWVERRIEGSHSHSKSLDSQPFTAKKLVKKSVKHLIWAAISLLTALVFISYFVPVEQLYMPFFTMQSSSLTVSWVLFFAVCTYINAGWIREKMCQHMCPYARFQSAMFDKSTKLVSYDQQRGENRGRRKRLQEKREDMGDCVNCNLCVQVCPVGIDIRNGLQYECINCALCVDACDMIMEKFNYQKGLIAFTSEQTPFNGWKRHAGYGSFIAITLMAIIVWGQTWQDFEVNIIRDRQALYRVNQEGKIENSFIIKIRNKSSQSKQYKIELAGLDSAKIIGASQVEVFPHELRTISIVVSVDNPLIDKKNDISFEIVDESSKSQIVKHNSFYSGERGW
ncbi:cytochrome c oxidase accessory protein CcoG [Colwellia sp. 1_MG-2023]|uniref:cytochrome c oxidase accessory protein CcoG n=1 Tax=Colwellia sp. 1_MG-2023 TaxID=3062649 RepID=UPI0026E3D401|nr:cytochrome c oxidase accessory protein CcoG [Colwellia sp. 1_MG-2023]MDO6447019.1 cytochrome c oxidase accessory protein CcoG [Colwellia sp. 1_MG-2023]